MAIVGINKPQKKFGCPVAVNDASSEVAPGRHTIRSSRPTAACERSHFNHFIRAAPETEDTP